MINGIERRFVKTRSGVAHIAEAGSGDPILLLHQTPRSWDEFRDVLPLLAVKYRAIAMDTRGFGDSDPFVDRDYSVENWADAVIDLADALGLDRFHIGGHHTGGAIALDVAARYPHRIKSLILSATSFTDAEKRRKHQGHRVIDAVEAADDGQHLAELWQRRRPYYPETQPQAQDLLSRFMCDALKAGPMAAEGHRVVNRYHMEDRIGDVRCPTLILAPTADPHAYPYAQRLKQEIADAVVVDIAGAMVPFPDQMPNEFSAVVTKFLDAQ